MRDLAECLDCSRPADHPYSCTFSESGDPIYDALVPACWPEWATNEEDGDVWTLRSLGWTAEQAWAEVLPFLLIDDGYVLERVREVPMVYLPDAGEGDDWRIEEAHPDEHDQVAVYVRWELAEADSAGSEAPAERRQHGVDA